MPADTPDFVQSLLDPKRYPHRPESVELVQTHISWVFLAGDLVYKFKKPVNFGFLDFSDLAKRRHCCKQELLLNRRLCPDIYLNLVTLTRDSSGFALLDGEAEPFGYSFRMQMMRDGEAEGALEYAVKMRRMPEERMMPKLIAAGKLAESHLDAVVDVLAPFYEKAATGGEIDGFGKAEAVAVNVLENFEQTEAFIDRGALTRAQFDAVSAKSRAVLADGARFERRIAAGRIRDCHGDLYSANICLAEKPYIFDCIEFNQRFRHADVASDVAFLAMDLDFHGLEDLSRHFIERFVQVSGDAGLPDMLDFYKCYRAYVRGKIGLFTASDAGLPEAARQEQTAAAARYFKLAERYAARI